MTSGAYCAVQGCKNQKTMKEISFFKLPTDVKRREDWLYMIGRPDLQRKPDLKPECHFVCHVHFEEYMMFRKPMLRPNAIPTKNVPTLPILNEVVQTPKTKEDKSTQTRKKFYKDFLDCNKKGGFKEETRNDEFDSKKPKNRKLEDKFAESEKKRKKLENEVKELKKQLAAAQAGSPYTPSTELSRNVTETCKADNVITPSSTVTNCGTDDVADFLSVFVKVEHLNESEE